MPNPYGDGTFIWYWYEWGFPIVVSAIALAITVGIFLTTDRKPYGVITRTLAVLVFLGTVPLAEERIGIGISGTKEGMAMINLLGGFGSGLLGVIHFLWYGKTRQAREAQIREPEPANASTPDPTRRTETLVPARPEAREPHLPETAERSLQDSESRIDLDDPEAETESEVSAQPAWLVFQTGVNAGQTIPISAGRTRIGRDPDNDIVISDDTVSRQHLEVTFVDGQYQASDVGSAVGTLIEGTPALEATILESGSTMRLGATDILFMQGETEIPSSPAPDVSSGDPSDTILVACEIPEMLTAWLAVIDGPSTGATCQIRVGSTSIGRGSDNDLVLQDAGVSRSHALVVADEDSMKLFDLASSGSTLINGTRQEPATLSTTSVVKLGDTELMLVDVDPGEQAEPEALPGPTDATIVARPAEPSGRGVLVVKSGPDAGATFQLSEGDNVIGRLDADILLTDKLVSRKHAVIRRSADSYIAYDLGSTGGTTVDGVRIEGDELSGGDKIVVGGSTIVVMDPTVKKS